VRQAGQSTLCSFRWTWARTCPTSTPLHFYHGLADEIAPPGHLELFARAVPQAQVHRLPERDHQLNDDLKEVAATIVSLAG
jgi:hypothetical protein